MSDHWRAIQGSSRRSDMPGILIYVLLLVVVSGCGANDQATRPAPDLMASTLFSRDQCNTGKNHETAVWIDSQKVLADVLRDINIHIISDDLPVLPHVDFNTEAVLLVAMGQQPSSGYHLSLADPVIAVTDDTANIMLEWHHPEQGLITASVITHPCLLIKLPLSDYSSVIVWDTLGKIRASLAVPKH